MATLFAMLLSLIFADAARAEDAVVMRSSAPNVPAMSRVAEGQMLSLPAGASVTLLYRGGGFLTLTGSENGARVRVAKPDAQIQNEMLRAALDKPSPLRQAAATRTEEDMILEALRRGQTPQGDYITELRNGCATARCRALQRLIDETAPPSLTMLRDPYDGSIALTANMNLKLSCWRFDPGARPTAIPTPERIEANQTLSMRGAAPPQGGFVGCAGAPGQADLARSAQARDLKDFLARAEGGAAAAIPGN